MDFEDVASSYRRFAEREIQNAPVYVDWCMAVVNSPQARELIAELPRIKRQPNLVFAAARFLSGEAVSGEDSEPDAPMWVLDTAGGPAFIEFLTAH